MNIQRKTILITGTALVVGILMLFVMLRSIVTFGYLRVEETEAIDETRHVVDLVTDDLEDMKRTAIDYAAWDDTYAFLGDENLAYFEQNITDRTLANLQFNVMLFVRPDHTLLRAKAIDLRTGTNVPVAPSLLQALADVPVLTTHPTTQSHYAGILALPEGPLLLVSLPVITNSDEGPVRGSFIAGRFFDAAIIERIERILGVQITLRPFDDPDTPPDFLSARSALAAGRGDYTQAIDVSRFAGYTVIRDVLGRPAYLLRTIIGRDIRAQGRATLRYTLLSLVVVSVIFSLMTALILKFLVLTRMRNLSGQVRALGSAGAGVLAPREIRIDGNDELGDLARVVNGTFQSLRLTEEALRASNETLEHRVEERTAELREALGRVRSLEQFKDEVIRSMLSGLCTFDPSGNVTLLNPAGASILGVRESAAGLPLEAAVGPGFAAALRGDLTAGEAHLCPRDLRLALAGGRQIDVLYAFARTTEGGGERAQGIATFWDVTLLRRAEREMQRLERLAALGELAASVAHELRNPLTAMYSTMQYLEKILAGENRDMGRIVLENMERMETIIRRMSLLAREARFAPRLIDLRELVDAVLSFLGATLREKGIALRSTLAPGPLRVEGDPAQLHQALLNLMMNAVQAMPGGGQLEVELEGAWGPGVGTVTFSVADRGPGVDLAHFGRIFDPFFTTKERGTGLGLAITERLVRSHGGTIAFTNRADGGAVFSIELPWAADPPQEV